MSCLHIGPVHNILMKKVHSFCYMAETQCYLLWRCCSFSKKGPMLKQMITPKKIALRMSTAWRTAQAKIKEAQKKQKCQHDKKAKDPQVAEGDRVFVYSPTEKKGKAYKFARPFKGSYRVMKMLPNGAELSLIAEPTRPTIRVALNRLRHCPKEIPDSLAEQDMLQEPEEGEMDVEESASEGIMHNQEEQQESVAGVEPAQPAMRRRLVGHHRDAITKDGDT